jgi:hypothetical protein
MLLLMAGGEFSSASSKQLEVQQLGLIRDTATSICNTVKDASGKSTNSQVQGEIKGELSGLFSRLATAGLSGTGSITNETFDGLTRDATAAALSGDRDCRERVFDKMFDRISNSTEPDSESYDERLKKLITAGLCAPGTTMIIENSRLDNNGNAGLESNDPNQRICFLNSTASGNGKGGIILSK